MSQAQQQLYTHAAEPKAVAQRKPKYREEEASQTGTVVTNIMFDRRVVRGNTYAARILPAEAGGTLTGSTKRSTGSATKRSTGTRGAPPRTPDAVEGRKHIDIQTDAYLEELTDTVPEADNTTQTDAFLDRPPTPLFVPQKTGTDVTTQIADGDLFDFDFEVEPILEVLVGKVLEQGLMEVLEEEELAAMRSHQEHFEQIRNAELVATQRMEAAETRKIEEKERRMAQERDRINRERIVREKVAAATFSRGYLSGIIGTVFDQLQQSGHFYDPVLQEVQQSFMPWLKEQAAAYLSQGVIARQVVKKLVEAATEKVAANRKEAAARVKAQKAAHLAWTARQAKVAHQLVDLEEGRRNQLGAFILQELEPRLVTDEQIQAERDEMTAALAAKADADYEELKVKAAEEAKVAAEAKVAEQAAALEELKAAAAAEAQDKGEELPADWAPSEEEAATPVDVEAEVAAAVDAVVRPDPTEVTLDDILSSFLDKGVLTKDGIMKSMAIDALGEEAWFRKQQAAEASTSA